MILHAIDFIVFVLIAFAFYTYITKRYPLFIVTTGIVVWLVALIALGVL